VFTLALPIEVDSERRKRVKTDTRTTRRHFDDRASLHQRNSFLPHGAESTIRLPIGRWGSHAELTAMLPHAVRYQERTETLLASNRL